MVAFLNIALLAAEIWCYSSKYQSLKVVSILESTLEGKSFINLLWSTWASVYEISVAVVTATTLLLKWYAWAYDWVSKYYGENSHLFCLNGCLAWQCVIIKKGEGCISLRSLGELVREEVNGNPKVAIVPFLSLFFEFQTFIITLI